MKLKTLVSGLLIAAAMASCDKKPGSADKATSPAPTVTVKASGTVNPAVEDVPKAHVDSSPRKPIAAEGLGAKGARPLSASQKARGETHGW